MSDLFSPDAAKAVDQAQKLLAKAGSTTHPAERDAFMAKAQEIMTRYNIDTATIERAQGTSTGKREEQKVEGGFYLYQRELWKETARLNFCWYFTEEYLWMEYKRKKRHRVIGRTVNVASTKFMAGYLEEVIERELREHLHHDESAGQGSHQLYSRHANEFREGMVSRLIEKIAERFKKQLAAEAKERAKQAKAGRPDKLTGTAVALQAVKDAEHAGNYDFVHGDGAWAKLQAELADEAREQKEAEDAYTAWAKANPTEAAKREQETVERNRRYWSRYRGGARDYAERKSDRMGDAFYRGRDAAEKVGLDPQTTRAKPARRISHV